MASPYLTLLSAFFFLVITACNITKKAVQTIETTGGTNYLEYQDETTYFKNREDLIEDNKLVKNHNTYISLDSVELIANQLFLKIIRQEIRNTDGHFPPSHNFEKVRKQIENSVLYQLLLKMPKGAVLHGHFRSMGNYEWLVKRATYLPYCYVYTGEDNNSWLNGTFQFNLKNPGKKWRDANELRSLLDDPDEFDKELLESISIGKEDLEVDNIAEEHLKCFLKLEGLISYKPVYEAYFENFLESMINENIQYVEFRSSFNGMYDLKKYYFDPEDEIEVFNSVKKKIQQKYPDFNFKVIYSVNETTRRKTLLQHFEIANKLYQAHPELIAGFDFALSQPKQSELKQFLRDHLERKMDTSIGAPAVTPLFFNPNESQRGDNFGIYDAILLNCKRIGFAHELVKYPLLPELIKKQHIAIEVSPISNQMLGLVKDLRDHPAHIYINNGIPIVLSLNNKGPVRYNLSQQFYEAILAWNLDLRDLKNLIMYSVRHSTLDEFQQERLQQSWETEWKAFIDLILNNAEQVEK